MKRYSTSLVNNKWKLRCYLTHVRMAIKKKPKTKKQQVLEVWRKGSPDTLLVGMWNGAATMKKNMEFPQKNGAAKMLVFREGMSFERWFESWENFRFRLSPLFAVFCIILGPPFLKNRGKNIYLAESLRGFSEKASVKCSMREERIKHQSSFLPSYFWESPVQSTHEPVSNWKDGQHSGLIWERGRGVPWK